jgi:hypothetical protein
VKRAFTWTSRERFPSGLRSERPGRTAPSTAVPGGLLTRKRSQVQTLSRPPLFSLVKDLSAPSGQHSLHTAAALRPQAAPPPNRVGPPELDATGPPSPNDHAAWSPALGPSPWSGTTSATAKTPCGGTGEHLLRPMLPATGRHPGPGLAPPGPPSQGGAAAGTPAKRRPWLRSTLVAAGHGQPPHHRFPSGPMQAGDHAARGPRRHVEPAAPSRGGPPHRATPGSSAARTARRQRRGHQRPVRPDTWMPGRLNTGRWTSARPVGRTSSPRRRPGHGAWGRSAHPGRLRGDGTCTAALTAAATGQLPSTARHEAAPRRTALPSEELGREHCPRQ